VKDSITLKVNHHVTVLMEDASMEEHSSASEEVIVLPDGIGIASNMLAVSPTLLVETLLVASHYTMRELMANVKSG